MDEFNIKDWFERERLVRDGSSMATWTYGNYKRLLENLLYDLYRSASTYTTPVSEEPHEDRSYWGVGDDDSEFRDIGMAVWLCKHAGTLFQEVSKTLNKKTDYVNGNYYKTDTTKEFKLVNDIVKILKDHLRDTPSSSRLYLLSHLMISLGIGILPYETNWSKLLQEYINIQIQDPYIPRNKSIDTLNSERSVMRWAVEIELYKGNLSLNERKASFNKLIYKYLKKWRNWPLNNWAYLLLRLELTKAATPIAEMAIELSRWSGSLDTYGWALFFEREYEMAEPILSEALDLIPFDKRGYRYWSEVQYHRFQNFLWSKKLTDARMLLEEMQTKKPNDYWTIKATEFKTLLTTGDTLYDSNEKSKNDKSKFEYDVAISFASEDRKYADELARLLNKLGIKVFYDDYERVALWGEDLYKYLTTIFKDKARFCVIFISENYANKRWANLECKAAQARSFFENHPYILPIRLDDTEIPGILPTIGYMSWEKDGLKLITDSLLKKLNLS